MMTPLDFLFLINLLAALVGIVINVAYVLTRQRRKSKNPLRLFAAIALGYFVVIYAMPLVGVVPAALRSGVLTRGGVFVLICLLIADVILDWRTKD